MMKTFLLVTACLTGIISCGQTGTSPRTIYVPEEKTEGFSWGGSTTLLKIARFGNNPQIVMLNLHADETTSIEAARKVLSESGGLLVTVENNKQRLIQFENNGRSWQFDPNRIFTKKGIGDNIKKLNGATSQEAIRIIDSFATFILSFIPSQKVPLITLHNNGPGGLSINSYRGNGLHAKDALKSSKSSRHDPDNFFLTTDMDIFQSLKKAGYNTVLQANDRAADDGSLSVYYGKKELPYINSEAESGQLREQTEMLRKVIQLLDKN